MASSQLARQISDIMSSYTADPATKLPGVTFLITKKDGTPLVHEVSGTSDISQPEKRLEKDDVYWVASMTKLITTVAAMQLVEQKKVELDEDITLKLPDLAALQVLEGYTAPDASGKPILKPRTGPITLRQLLTHTSGCAYGLFNPNLQRYNSENKGLHADGLSCKKSSLTLPLAFQPGTKWEYGVGIDWAGQLIEVISGKTLDAYCKEHIFGPLGMSRTSFILNDEMRAHQVAVHARDGEGKITKQGPLLTEQPEVHMGGAGCYTTASDYTQLLLALVNDGRHPNGVQILQPESVKQIEKPQLTKETAVFLEPTLRALMPNLPAVKSFGLSVLILPESTGGGESIYSWGGYPNCRWWADKNKGIVGVILNQLVPPGDSKVDEFNQKAEAAVYKYLAAQSQN